MQKYLIYEVPDIVENFENLEKEFNLKNCAFYDWDLLNFKVNQKELFISVVEYNHNKDKDLLVEFKLTNFEIKKLKLIFNKINMDNIRGIFIDVSKNKINFIVSFSIDNELEIDCEKISVNKIQLVDKDYVTPFLFNNQYELKKLLNKK